MRQKKMEEAMRLKCKVTIAAALFCLTTVFAYSDDGKEVKGMIKSRSGETMVVQTDSTDVTVVLTEGTKTRDKRGLFGLDKEEVGATVLIPGLKVDIDGSPDDQGRVVAKTITVDGDDLEASQMIQAGLHPTAEQVSANVQRLESHQQGIATNREGVSSNKQGVESNATNIASNKGQIENTIKQVETQTLRFASLDDYDVKHNATVKFNSGSSNLSKADQQQLKELATNATGNDGYLVEVIGFADSTGQAAMNTSLSEKRARSVVTYLTQQCGIPVRRIVAPGAMGEYGSTGSNETKQGRAENRRAEVKVLVNKGIVAAQ